MAGVSDKFPTSLPDFQRMFPDDGACARYLESVRWRDGFVCPRCQGTAEPMRLGRPHLLRCRNCKRDISLTAGTVMDRTHTPLSTWFWASYLVSSLTPGMSAVQLQRQLGLTRYETAFQILHKLRAGMARPGRDRIGGHGKEHVEIDETWVGGETQGRGKGTHDMTLVVGAVEVKPRRGRRYAGRLRLSVIPDKTPKSCVGFVEGNVEPSTWMVVTDGSQSYAPLVKSGYQHLRVPERGEPDATEDYLPIIHLVFSNLKAWINGTHHGVSADHLQAYLNEFTFRFNRRFYPHNSFRSLLGLAMSSKAPTYDELYGDDYDHPGTATGVP